ncbi:hypothetical protein ACWD4V_17755 [Streptomyces tsukubensis]
MTSEELLTLIARHWPDIRQTLPDEQYTVLADRIVALAEAENDPRELRRALQGVRLALLPLPLDHPVRLALETTRLAPAAIGPGLAEQSLRLAELVLNSAGEPADQPETPHQDPPEQGPDADAADIFGSVRRRLLATPTLSPDEARERCSGTPPGDGLIRLDDPLRGPRYPAFQFPEGAQGPPSVVREVNRLLLAEEDPWGAADWWLSGNRWLGGRPSELLGRLSDELLIGAAAAMVEVD